MADALAGRIDQVDILIIRAVYQIFGIHIIAKGNDTTSRWEHRSDHCRYGC